MHKSWANDERSYAHFKIKEVGYVLSKAYWGRGLMPEAVTAVIRFCFDKCRFTFVKQGEHYAKQLKLTFADMKYILLHNLYF